MKKSIKGFTLIELIVVVVIVTILSIVAVPMYKTHIKRAMLTEGKSAMSTIELTEKVYYCENSFYHGTSQTSFDEVLNIDLRSNKYFTSFEISEEGDNYVATITGVGAATGISLTLTVNSIKDQSTLIINGIE